MKETWMVCELIEGYEKITIEKLSTLDTKLEALKFLEGRIDECWQDVKYTIIPIYNQQTYS